MRTFIIIAAFSVLLANDAKSQNFSHNNYLFETTEKNYIHKNPALVETLSVGVTVGSILVGRALIHQHHNLAGGLLVGEGLWIGPSAGNMYVGNSEGVWKGIGSRLIGGAGAFTGLYILFMNNFCIGPCEHHTNFADYAGNILFLGGIGLILYSTIYDWVNSVFMPKRKTGGML